MNYQPRYVAYAQSNGLQPEAMLAADTLKWPGGKMCGYLLWIKERWQEWDRLHKASAGHIRSIKEHEQFDAWLQTRAVDKAAS